MVQNLDQTSEHHIYANKMQDLISILGLLIMHLNVECDDLYQKITLIIIFLACVLLA